MSAPATTPVSITSDRSDPRGNTGNSTGRAGGHKVGRWRRLRHTPTLVQRLSLGILIVNALLVVTGGAVRLTDSGLGCPTWPRCTDASYHNTPAAGIHGYIEFGNRVLGAVLGILIGLAVLAALVQRHRRRPVVWLAAAQFLGFVGQAVLGGITVLTGLNPWTVAGHFLMSMVLLYGAYALWQRTREGDGRREFVVATPLVWLVRAMTASTALALLIGTIVTGSGPHAGDRKAAARTGFDPQAVTQLHTDAVFLLVGLTLGAVLIFQISANPRVVRNAVVVLLMVELGQGTIGFVQYFTQLPVALVAAHLLGATCVWLAMLRVLFLLRTRSNEVSGRPQNSISHRPMATAAAQ